MAARIGGDAARTPLELSLDQLRKNFEQVEIAALCLCSGNRRGSFEPSAPGLQWGFGAMGNALWRGVRLKDVLAGAGIDKSALEVTLIEKSVLIKLLNAFSQKDEDN